MEHFIGDAVVAAFFDETGGSGLRQALVAASDMRRMHEVLQARRRDAGEFTYEIGVGLATGKILSGTLASSDRLEHLLLGQPCRLAESLEGLSRKGKATRIGLSPNEGFPIGRGFAIEWSR